MIAILRRYLFLIIVLLFLFAQYSFHISNKKNNQLFIHVEVCGELFNPGAFTLPLGSKFKDLINQLQLKETSDISLISYNKPLSNNEVINIRTKKLNDDYISINSANINELTKLEGIGKIIAQRIIDYRNNNSCFHSLEELMNVKGIGKAKYEKIKDKITL